MRVALNGSFWNEPRTGSGQYLRHLWGALLEIASSNGDTLLMLLPPGEPPDEPVPLNETSGVVHARRLPVGGGRNPNLDKLLWEQWGVVSLAQRLEARLLHVPYLAAPLRKPCPTIVTAHDMIPWVLPGYKGSPAVRLYLALAAAGAKHADLILADSDASRRDVIKVLRVDPRRVRTVYLGVSAPAYTREEVEEACARFNLPDRFAFYIGGFDRRKSVPMLLRAWHRWLVSMEWEWPPGEEPVLAIGGAVPDPSYPQQGGIFPNVRAVASALFGRTDRIRFLGRISERDKFLLMAAARLFVYPSSYEGFGLDPLEAMSVGCAVISSSGGSLPEVVGDAGLLVPPDDEEALCQAIMRAWGDDTLRAELGTRGLRRAKLFTWERTASQTYDLYRQALGRRRVGES